MMEAPNWLPQLVLLHDYGGNWERYLTALYRYFKADFIDTKPIFDRRQLAIKSHPLFKNKEATFWHLISEGKEKDEKIDLRRCERIRWPRPIIENSTASIVKCWKNIRKGEVRICLWLENQEYLVVLAERKGYILLWTAYMVTRSHRKRKLQKEYEDYWGQKC
jgi:hypothetical protein